jgi:tetratricopeptide (TPR) repeat protein
MKKAFWKLIAIFPLCLSLAGCVKMALKFAPSFIPSLSQTFFEECDPDLARQSLPASLKLMEGLLKNDPENKQILTTLCTAFTGYAILFVEEDDPEAASSLYLRAREYGFKALGRKWLLSKDASLKKDIVQDRVNAIGEKELEALFWTVMAWNAWINLNLDKPAALGQLSAAQTCLNRVLEIKADYFYGSPYILLGTLLAAMPGPLGGDELEARRCFEKALQLGEGKFFLAHYYFARYYAVRVQDKDLFIGIIDEVQSTSPNELKEVCLINSVMKQKTKRLLEMSEDLFL